jgi:hypothetical protein
MSLAINSPSELNRFRIEISTIDDALSVRREVFSQHTRAAPHVKHD